MRSHDQPAPTYRLTLRALRCPDGIPPEIRLRRALKYLLRATNLRCLSVEQDPPRPAEDLSQPDGRLPCPDRS